MATGRGRRRARRTDVDVRRVQHGETWVRVSSIGADGERPFVLVPGIGVSSDYFERLAPRLREFGPVHAVDLPGFAGVPHPRRAMSIDDYGELVGVVIDDLGLVDPVVVGHSMGSQVVTSLLVARPQLSTAVLIGPVVDVEHRSVPAQAVAFLRCAVREPGRVKLLAVSSYLLCGVRWFVRVLPRMMTYPLEDRIGHVRARTLLVRGEFDHVCPTSWLELLLAGLEDGRAWQVPDAAHSVMHAHADTVAALCVRHARGELPGDDAVELVPSSAASEQMSGPASAPGPEAARHALRGRLIEWWGLLRRDEDRVARGKRMRMGAVLDDVPSQDRPGGPRGRGRPGERDVRSARTGR